MAVTLVCVWAGGIPFLIATIAGGVVVSVEWVTLCGVEDPFWIGRGGTSLVIGAAAIAGGLGEAEAGLAFVAVATLGYELLDALAGGSLFRPGGTRFALGIPWLGLAAVAVPWLRNDPEAGLANTLFMLCIVWGSDIGAYLLGRFIGGPKLAPAISPGKTWSGASGGLIGALLGGLLVATCFSTVFSPASVIVLALGLGVVSQAGDLLESGLKRHFGVKDSGRIIPGHGGLLDRLDSLLAVAPAAALLAYSLGRGVLLWR